MNTHRTFGLLIAVLLGAALFTGTAVAQVVCAEGSDFGQTPTPPPSPRIWASDELIDYYVGLGALLQTDYPVAYDNYSTGHSIGKVEWWGTELNATTQSPSTRAADLFTITFYTNDTSGANPMPGTVAGQYANLAVTKTDTGVRHLNPNTFLFEVVLYHYSVELPSPCTETGGWISIKGSAAGSSNGVVFVWISSSGGDQNMREYNGTDLPYRVRTGDRRDTAFCLFEAPVEVPNVVGMTQSEAEDALLAAGLTVIITLDYSETMAQGNVILQNPIAGSLLDAGASVTLVISRGPAPAVPALGVIPFIMLASALGGLGMFAQRKRKK